MSKVSLKQRQEEDSRLRWLKRYTDWVTQRLLKETFSEAEAVKFLENVRCEILNRFPDKEKQYDIIYDRRFKRILLKRGIFLKFSEGSSKGNIN